MSQPPCPKPKPYQSALDLPSFRELLEQIRSMKMLTRFIARQQRKEVVALEAQLRHIAKTVDDFYDCLGPRNWVMSDRVSLEAVRAILDTTDTPEGAEQAFVDLHRDPERLRLIVMPLRGIAELRSRMHLIERAMEDYQAERWSTATLMLLTVMDGFVNDFENKRRGLHARDADDMNAWDSVVGHHLGLSNAHRSFTRTIGRTTDVECFELHRNGIIHGTILNYDNSIVATKAWNRLFAVADWARSMEREKTPKKSEPSWREVLGHVADNARAKKALDAWQPSTLTPDDPSFDTDPAFVTGSDYLTLWKHRNYGEMAPYLSHLVAAESLQKTAGRISSEYKGLPLDSFTIDRLDYTAAAVCIMDVTLTLKGEVRPGRLRWIREQPDGSPAAPNQEGSWRLIMWGPLAMLNVEQ